MKYRIWFKLGGNYYRDVEDPVYAGLAWYKHGYEQYKGLTIQLFAGNHMLLIYLVDNYAAYDKMIKDREEKRRRWRKKIGMDK